MPRSASTLLLSLFVQAFVTASATPQVAFNTKKLKHEWTQLSQRHTSLEKKLQDRSLTMLERPPLPEELEQIEKEIAQENIELGRLAYEALKRIGPYSLKNVPDKLSAIYWADLLLMTQTSDREALESIASHYPPYFAPEETQARMTFWLVKHHMAEKLTQADLKTAAKLFLKHYPHRADDYFQWLYLMGLHERLNKRDDEAEKIFQSAVSFIQENRIFTQLRSSQPTFSTDPQRISPSSFTLLLTHLTWLRAHRTDASEKQEVLFKKILRTLPHADFATAAIKLYPFYSFLENPLPNFDSQSLKEQKINNQSLGGRVTVLVFLNSNDAVSSLTLQALTAVAQRFKSLDILIVAKGESREQIEQWSEAEKITFPVIFQQNEKEGLFYDFHIPEVPTTMVLDRKGKVRAIQLSGYSLEKVIAYLSSEF